LLLDVKKKNIVILFNYQNCSIYYVVIVIHRRIAAIIFARANKDQNLYNNIYNL